MISRQGFVIILCMFQSYLSVNVSADLERRLQLQQDWLREEDFPGLEAQTADLVLSQLDVLAGTGAAD